MKIIQNYYNTQNLDLNFMFVGMGISQKIHKISTMNLII